MKQTALISVYHKEGIAEFARGLKELGWNILASSGTAKHLKEAGIEAQDVSELVGEPLLGHRVVTLSREIHAGLLARDTPEDRAELEKQGIPFIDLVCVDMYPLEGQVARLRASSAVAAAKAGQGFGGQAKSKGRIADSEEHAHTTPAYGHPSSTEEGTREAVIEMTDIGGPTMLRAGAKGGRIVVCEPADRARVLEWLRARDNDHNHNYDDLLVRELAAKAEMAVVKHAFASAEYLSGGRYTGVVGARAAECLYGENAWQTPAALYSMGTNDPLTLDKFQLIEGTPLSYHNWCDTDRLLQTLTHIAAGLEVNTRSVPRIAVAVKHGNPCGAAYGADTRVVLENMISGDPLAIMGGVVMTNFPIGAEEAETLASFKMKDGTRRLLDVVIASAFDEAARELLRRKKDKCRFLANEHLARAGRDSLDTAPRLRYARGGFLKQPNYTFVLNVKDASVKKYGPAVSPEVERDMVFAWAVGSTSNSNTITLAKGGMLLGDGVGQQDRVGAAELALRRAHRAGHDTQGAVAYSDSFFPFPDAPQVLIDAGVHVILSTSGSVRDEDTIKLCERKGISLYLVPDKEGRGFFGH
jgi:phosphoribosylaminoimidazolecarboxamide formyltransferase/IMP cyclohydrolase